MHEKVLISNADFFADIAETARQRAKLLAVRLAELKLKSRDPEIVEIHQLSMQLLDDLYAVTALVLDHDTNVIIDQGFIEGYVRSVYGLDPTNGRIAKLAASIRRACMFGFIGVDLD